MYATPNNCYNCYSLVSNGAVECGIKFYTRCTCAITIEYIYIYIQCRILHLTIKTIHCTAWRYLYCTFSMAIQYLSGYEF